ncbi:unnamed protein product [Acanthocheilonema viteae]|uniref:Uncharacterized protein n=1 Tax=Acanthocheilonema viteae TaxID=6277 RepID=A0A498S2B0_ACAVI|nr:unnamed protein product [Acanthocheilonema viteae]
MAFCDELSYGIEPNQPKKAIVEHSIRLSFHNDLPKSEGSGEYSHKPTAKHHPRTPFISPDRTQSGVIGLKDLVPSKKHAPELYLKAQTVGKSVIVGSKKLTDDKTQISASSADFTQFSVVSEGNDKQSSKTLTESTIIESKKQTKSKNVSEYGKALQEAVTQNTVSQVLNAVQEKEKQRSEVEESASIGESIASITEDPKQSGTSSTRSIQPG